LVVGEAGIGKTRLVEELAREASGGFGAVLWGRCWEGEGAPPYWPWVKAIRTCLFAPGLETGPAARGMPYLAQLLPELRQRFPDPAAAPTSPGSDHARLPCRSLAMSFCVSRGSPCVPS